MSVLDAISYNNHLLLELIIYETLQRLLYDLEYHTIILFNLKLIIHISIKTTLLHLFINSLWDWITDLFLIKEGNTLLCIS